MMRQHISKYPLVYSVAVMLWLKTYIVQKFYFDLPINSLYQEFILLISSISSVCLLLAVGFFVFKKRKNLSMILVSLISSLILISNIVYYRFFHDFITLPTLFQTKNAGDLGSSVIANFNFWDLWLFIDFFALLFLVYRKKMPEIVIQKKQLIKLVAVAVVIFMVNWGLAEMVRPGILTRSFDRQIIVKSIGPYNYHFHDAILNSRMKTKKAFANSTNLIEAELYIEETNEEKEAPSELFGAAKGKNVIIISMESIQEFVIGRSVEGEEITPFLNDLLQDSYYFSEFYHQTGQGKTSDAEFLLDNSLYPLPSGAVFFTHAENTYLSTPKILKEHGYYSAAFHANDSTFWNREQMYKNLGYDRFLSKENYSISEENSIGWGLKDIDFFEQSMLHLKYLPQPFYSKFITLTNHHPYTLSEEDQMIEELNSSDELVNRYVTTVRYMDEAIKVFFDRLKQQGLYENSIFILYGDHYGVSQYHNKALGEFLGKEITPFEHIQLQKVPMIIHIPGHEPKMINEVSGQVDIRPTLLNLLGVELEQGLYFGEDMFSKNEDSFVVLRNGSYITEEYVHTKGVCYLKSSGEEVQSDECADYQERAVNELNHSDEIIYGDLMRFKEKEEETKDVEEVKEEQEVVEVDEAGEVDGSGESGESGEVNGEIEETEANKEAEVEEDEKVVEVNETEAIEEE
jgi:lipoteichoic acid synthase